MSVDAWFKQSELSFPSYRRVSLCLQKTTVEDNHITLEPVIHVFNRNKLKPKGLELHRKSHERKYNLRLMAAKGVLKLLTSIQLIIVLLTLRCFGEFLCETFSSFNVARLSVQIINNLQSLQWSYCFRFKQQKRFG